MRRLLVSLGLSGLSIVSAAQQTAQERPAFRSGVELVQLDVTVFDAERRLITGLTAGDFTILIDGKPQRVVTFAEVTPPPALEGVTGWVRDVAPDVRDNREPAERRLFVIVMDDAMMPSHPTIAQNAQKAARAVIDSMGPQDLAAVIFTLTNTHAQDFTADRMSLRAAIDGFRPRFATFSAEVDWAHRRSAAFTIVRAAESLAEAAGRRKAMIVIGVSAFGGPDFAKSVQSAEFGLAGGSIDAPAAERDLFFYLQQAMRNLQRSNTTIYAIDPSGVGGLESYLQVRSANLAGAAAARASGTAAGAAVNPAARAKTMRESLQIVAEMTGGFAVVNTNDFTPGISRIFREQSSYYLVGFEQAHEADGRYRRIELQVSHPGATARTRRGYFASRKTSAETRAAAAPLDDALSGLVPRANVGMQMSAAPFARPGAKTAAVVITIRLQDAAHGAQVDLLMRAFTPQGKPRAARTLTVPPDPARKAATSPRDVVALLDLAPGRYALRVSALNRGTGDTGSVYQDVIVPDFAKSDLSLSGLVLADARAPDQERPVLEGIIPMSPTNTRDFAASDDVQAFVRVYQRERGPLRAVDMAARIVDERERTVHNVHDRLESSTFGPQRTADYRLTLPLAKLPTGRYLLTFEAGGSSAIRRQIPFTVR